MKEGNEPTRRRVLICICLKWQVREQEEGCGFLPFRRRRGAELRGAELLSEPLSTLVPPTSPTCHLHPRQEERGQGEIRGRPSKKAQWKPRKSIKAQPATSWVPPGSWALIPAQERGWEEPEEDKATGQWMVVGLEAQGHGWIWLSTTRDLLRIDVFDLQPRFQEKKRTTHPTSARFLSHQSCQRSL